MTYQETAGARLRNIQNDETLDFWDRCRAYDRFMADCQVLIDVAHNCIEAA